MSLRKIIRDFESLFRVNGISVSISLLWEYFKNIFNTDYFVLRTIVFGLILLQFRTSHPYLSSFSPLSILCSSWRILATSDSHPSLFLKSSRPAVCFGSTAVKRRFWTHSASPLHITHATPHHMDYRRILNYLHSLSHHTRPLLVTHPFKSRSITAVSGKSAPH